MSPFTFLIVIVSLNNYGCFYSDLPEHGTFEQFENINLSLKITS